MLLKKISDVEKCMIESAIRGYTSNSYIDAHIDLDYVLRFWNENKRYLFNILGENLILSKNIEYTSSKSYLNEKMDNLMYSCAFGHAFRKKVLDPWISDFSNGRAIYWNLSEFFSANTFVDNYYYGETIEFPAPETGEIIKITHGCKPMKACAKLAKIFDLPEFEEFRLEHSRILNNKILKGKLNLSIHPLDYITMSENNYNWTSCMSWSSNGCYRQGTVEMMNSDMVIVAYISGNEDMKFFNSTWNSKKWRQLFIVNSDIITNIKAYPYRNDELTDLCLEWIRDLVNAHDSKIHSRTFFDDKIMEYDTYEFFHFYNDDRDFYMVINPSTEIMYNDFSESQRCILNKEVIDDAIRDYKCGYNYHLDFNYSGESECMICGETGIDFADEGCLICEDCDPRTICDCCGCYVDEDELVEIDGQCYCDSCLDEYTSICPITGERHSNTNMKRLYVTNNMKDPSCGIGVYITIEGVKKMIADYGAKIYGFKRTYGYYSSMFVDLADFTHELRVAFELYESHDLEYYADMNSSHGLVNKESLVLVDVDEL